MDDTETGVTCIVHGHRDVTDCSLSDSSGMDTSCVRWLISLSCLMDQGTYRLFSKHTPAAQHPLRRMRSSHLSLAEQRTRTRQCDVIIVISERARSAPALQRGSVSLCGRGRSTPKNSVFRPNLVATSNCHNGYVEVWASETHPLDDCAYERYVTNEFLSTLTITSCRRAAATICPPLLSSPVGAEAPRAAEQTAT